MTKSVYVEGDGSVSWKAAVHTDREVTENSSDIIIKNQKLKTRTLIYVEIPAYRNAVEKGSGKEVKMEEFGYRDTTNVEPEIYDYTSYSWSHWNCNEMLKEISGSYTRKTFDRFTSEDSYTWNITHNTESTAA
jgi:hypothetical protein